MASGRHERDPALEALIDAAGRGRVDPRGYREVGLLSNSRVPHNPYSVLLTLAMFVAFGVFLLVKLWPSWVGIALFVFFVGAALTAGFFTARRIAAWHRARRVAVAYVAEHGGSMPRELRFWG